MDKQMIEEMAKHLHSTHAVSAICSGKDCNHCKHANLKRFDDYTCIDLDLAEALYNAGYRKIPENAVVIPDMADKDFYAVEKSEWDKMVQGTKDIIREREEKARKETAEKLLDKVDNESNGQTKAITDLLRKEYGVEVK